MFKIVYNVKVDGKIVAQYDTADEAIADAENTEGVLVEVEAIDYDIDDFNLPTENEREIIWTNKKVESKCCDKEDCIVEDFDEGAIEKAKAFCKEQDCYAVIYGYQKNGKFVELPEMIPCADVDELRSESELVDLQYDPTGSLRVIYKDSLNLKECGTLTEAGFNIDTIIDNAIENWAEGTEFAEGLDEDVKVTISADEGEDVKVVSNSTDEKVLTADDALNIVEWPSEFEPRANFDLTDISKDEAEWSAFNDDDLCCKMNDDGTYECSKCEEEPEKVDAVITAEMPKETVDELEDGEVKVEVPETGDEVNGEVEDVIVDEIEDKVVGEDDEEKSKDELNEALADPELLAAIKKDENLGKLSDATLSKMIIVYCKDMGLKKTEVDAAEFIDWVNESDGFGNFIFEFAEELSVDAMGELGDNDEKFLKVLRDCGVKYHVINEKGNWTVGVNDDEFDSDIKAGKKDIDVAADVEGEHAETADLIDWILDFKSKDYDELRALRKDYLAIKESLVNKTAPEYVDHLTTENRTLNESDIDSLIDAKIDAFIASLGESLTEADEEEADEESEAVEETEEEPIEMTVQEVADVVEGAAHAAANAVLDVVDEPTEEQNEEITEKVDEVVVDKIQEVCPEAEVHVEKEEEEIAEDESEEEEISDEEFVEAFGKAMFDKKESLVNKEAEEYVDHLTTENRTINEDVERNKEVNAYGNEGSEVITPKVASTGKDSWGDPKTDVKVLDKADEAAENNEKTEKDKLVKSIDEFADTLTTETDCKLINKDLNEDLDLDKKLKEHNEYIKVLQDEIAKEEKEIANAKNEFIKKMHESNLESLKAALDKAIPEEVKAETQAEELPTPEEAAPEADLTDNASEATTEEVPAEEVKTESLTEDKKKDSSEIVDEAAELDEAYPDYYEQERKMMDWHNGYRKQGGFATMTPEKFKMNYEICITHGYTEEAKILLDKARERGISWAVKDYTRGKEVCKKIAAILDKLAADTKEANKAVDTNHNITVKELHNKVVLTYNFILDETITKAYAKDDSYKTFYKKLETQLKEKFSKMTDAKVICYYGEPEAGIVRFVFEVIV